MTVDLNRLQRYSDLTYYAVLECHLCVLCRNIEVTFYTGNGAS